MPTIVPEVIDWSHLVSLDFETFYDEDYTLTKLSTSEYVRDERFEATMVGIKVGRKKRVVVPGPKIKAALAAIDWKSYSLLCHNTQFDAFILSHHYDIVPKRYYCTLSMARGLHSNEIGAGLNEVAQFYGRAGKLKGTLEAMKGKRYKQLVEEGLYETGAEYCGVDVDEMLGIFEQMVPKMPVDEMDLIDLTVRMFCDPVLRVDLPRVQAELDREIKTREELFTSLLDTEKYAHVLKTKGERSLTGNQRAILITRRMVGSNAHFASLLTAEGIVPPRKISPAWIKTPKHERTDEDKYTYAFAKTDLEFIGLPDNVEQLCTGINLGTKAGVRRLKERSDYVRRLVDARLLVKSTISVTRAQRFLEAGKNGWRLPVGYSYYRAHTGRWGGNNRMNMQNLTRGGELRAAILAAIGYHIVTVDSGQIEARVNAWLWDEKDLLDAFRAADLGTGSDAYCRFASLIYGREITKKDVEERFLGKVCVLGLGYGMSATKLMLTLARGALGGPPVILDEIETQRIVNLYRKANRKIVKGWQICNGIIEDMAFGREGSHKCISWSKSTIWLPNGMTLKYPDLKKSVNENGMTEWTYQSGEQRKKLYGAMLCENLVQALARIIVAGQMLVISKKHRVVMTTHDEVSAVVKAAQSAKALSWMIDMMRIPPAWCADLPLNAEGAAGPNYSK